ncbi:hypothetical protein EJ03DRAFT_332073 [Teratosphaeria nubilosa]|uniref:Stress response protein NST1 n=1 Tax=Teratosphaeria nubilosa TaxID=161662 RepID=A0A6G1KVJ1_9PEZI|nr:hypothetical protein EJ03DRAFT_332073 [Teratosphaeria nubilosa]
MAANTRLPPPTSASNGVIHAPSKPPNRKKQKRRDKQAQRQATQAPPPPPAPAGTPAAERYDEDPLGYGEDEEEYDDYSEVDEPYLDQYAPPHPPTNGVNHAPAPVQTSKNKKKRNSGHHGAYHPDMLSHLGGPPPPPSHALRPMHRGANYNHHDNQIWNTSSAQERQNIKEFWLGLSEEERKSLLKIEKEAVLKKMKQQQKHSCSCTVCGRKRTAIEEELEVLYEGYYEELEQYAHHDQPPLLSDGLTPAPLQHPRPPHPLAAPPPNPHHKTSRMQEHIPPDEAEDDEESEGEYEDEEYSEEDYSDEEPDPPRGVPDFFSFGQSLTVKDNLLTVADDLLKNDGRKFIEMMEQLAERRMQRENEAEYAAANPSHPPGSYQSGNYGHDDPLAEDDGYDDDEEEYDSEMDDDYPEDEDEMGGLTEEQRMQEGRRMFQIFAARMFEQRVLNAYREKVAAERQQKLLEELQDEEGKEAQRKAKKERDALKKKEKKKQQQQAKAEEKAKKEAEKAAEEARLREAQEKQQEEQRRKKEEQKRKREEEKRKQEEERARKEAEKLRRQAEEQQRREEAERKAREAKAKKEEQKKREREEREAREKEIRERKALEERERKERDAKAKAETESKEREKNAQQAASTPSVQQQPQPPQITKRPSQMGMVAVPGVYPKQTASGISSPHPSIATPALPKAPTPAKQRQASQQGSHASSPKQALSQVSSVPSKTSSPGGQLPQHNATQPKTIMQKPSQPQMGPQHPGPAMSPLHQHQMQPPPGMHHPQQHGPFGSMSPMPFGGYQGPQGPMMHNHLGQRGPLPGMFSPQVPPMGIPNRMSFGAPGGMNGMPMPPPGMSPQGRGFPFDAPQAPPGFGQSPMPLHHAPFGVPPPQQTPGPDASRPNLPTHSRQQSTDKERFDSAANQPIARPAPIQRPSSVKPQGNRDADVEDLSKHLGSSALLADDDEPLPGDARRMPGLQNGPRNGGLGNMAPMGGFGSPAGSFGAPGNGFPTPFGSVPGLGQPSWGAMPGPSIGGWNQNHQSFTANNGLGGFGAPMHRGSIAGGNRPLTIRVAVCNACKQLSARGDGKDGYHGVDTLLQQIDVNRPMLDSPPTLREIEEICETEGDAINGGGELYVRKSEGGDLTAVKWEASARTPDQGSGLGEIGSPMPGKSSPATGFGPPGRQMGMPGGFQSLGAIGSQGF